MTRRLFWILIAVTQIAALPLSIDPPTPEVGMPLTLSITLPDETTRLVGLPDLEPFVLLGSPERNGNVLTFRLLPLRPGSYSIPALPFQTAQRRDATAATPLTITAPTPPEAPHPLRPFPEPEQPSRPAWLWIPLSAGLAVFTLLSAILISQRRAATEKQSLDNHDHFSELATAAEKIRIANDPEWDRFCQRLDRIRFSPLTHSPKELQELTAEFARLRGATS